MSDEWEKVGQAAVDPGLIWIGDPCYTVSKDASHVWKTWKKFCNDHDKLAEEGDRAAVDFGKTGIAVETGYGDGLYNVYIKREDGLVKEAKIVFFGDEDNEQE